MKLDYELLRNMLLRIEEKTNGSTNFGYGHFFDIDPNADYETQRAEEHKGNYHMEYLLDDGLVYGKNGMIRKITPKGHELLANIRDDDTWLETKKVIADKKKALGTVGINIISEIAASILRKAFFQ